VLAGRSSQTRRRQGKHGNADPGRTLALRHADRVLPLRHALALGLLHGPTELLPVSSSGHTTLVPWLAGWRYEQLDGRLRKSFEVALHAGTATALLLRSPGRGPAGGVSFLLPAVIPPAVGGYLLGGPIERRLGTPATIALGLLAGSIVLGATELQARTKRPRLQAGVKRTRTRTGAPRLTDPAPPPSRSCRAAADATPRDGLALGAAQALALIPGVSRNGATLAVARGRGFAGADADRLSWRVGLPVIAGAAALQGTRLVRAGVPDEMRFALAAGAGASFISTLSSTMLLDSQRRSALLPACCAYRTALAFVVIRRMRNHSGARASSSSRK
jgi:undecaprenyl-diphosphatase